MISFVVQGVRTHVVATTARKSHTSISSRMVIKNFRSRMSYVFHVFVLEGKIQDWSVCSFLISLWGSVADQRSANGWHRWWSEFFTVSARASCPKLRDACMKIASALNWIIQKSYSMYTPGVARTVPLVALHTLRAHCALCSFTFQVWVTPHLAQGHVERVCGGFAHVINLPISLVSPMLRPSPPTPSLLFPHGQRDWSAASDTFSD